MQWPIGMLGHHFVIGLVLGLVWTFITGVVPACAHIAASPFDRWAIQTPRAIDGVVVLETPAALATTAAAATPDSGGDPGGSIPVMTLTLSLVRASRPVESSTMSVPVCTSSGEEVNSMESTLTSAAFETEVPTSNGLTMATTWNISTVPTLATSVATSPANESGVNATTDYAKWTLSPALATSQASLVNVSMAVPATMAVGSLFLAWAFFAQ